VIHINSAFETQTCDEYRVTGQFTIVGGTDSRERKLWTMIKTVGE